MVDLRSINFTNLNLFDSLCNKIACLVYSKTDGDKKVLDQILDSLNTLDYNLVCVKKERGTLLINQCCYLISPDEVSLTLKAVNLFTCLITKASISVEGKTLSLAVNWCLQCLKHGNQLNILKCLQALVKGKGKKIEEQSNQILSEIVKLSDTFTFTPGSEEICLNCLRYVEAVTHLSETENEVLAKECIFQYFKIFKEVLFRGKCYVVHNEIVFCKFLITAMRGVSNLIQMSDEIIVNYLGDILGIIKGYMLYGLPGHENYEIQKLLPTSTTVPEVLKSLNYVKKLRGKYDRRSKKVTVTSLNAVEEVDDSEIINEYAGFSETNLQTESLVTYKISDSDFSDGDYSQSTKIQSYKSKVRHCALILLGTVVEKTNRKVFTAYLPIFLPDNSQFKHMRTLITCLLEDPSSKCRSEAVRVLLMIISNSRPYFLQADGMSKSSFTAFSCTISNIIKELHRCLILALESEKNTTTIKHILKCISDLIRCTPYHKIESGLITSVAKIVKTFLNHNDVTVKIFALTIFGCIVSVEPKVKEVSDIIISKVVNSRENSRDTKSEIDDLVIDDLDIYEEEESETLREKPWLFQQCIQNLTDKNGFCDSTTNVALQVESLQVIGALSRNFFKETIVSFPNDVINLLQRCSNKSEYSIRLYSGKLMETILNSLQFSFSQEDESKKAPIALATQIWEALLPGPVTALIQSQEEPMLRCTGCDCIANVGVQTQNGLTTSMQNSLIFDQLPRDKQIMCVTHLFGCLRDESLAVRSSSARALAILVLFPSLREDSLFFLDVIDATIAAAKDEQSTVRTQASWLFGNLSEAVIVNKQKEVEDGVSLHLLAELLKTGIKLAGNSSKIKPGALRGIGNLLKTIDEDFLREHKELVVESLDALIENATSGTFMKARWNSCYAIANLLHNPLVHTNGEWMTKIFNVAIPLVQHYKNFKVRIGASLVLGAPPTRESYGDLYNTVWSAVLNALENSKNISDFNEYQHRDQLVDQLCLVMCHLISLVDPGDLNSLQDILYFHLNNLNYFMAKFHERIVPEKSNVLLNATVKIHSLLDENGLTVEERSLIRVLQNTFVSEN